MSFLNVRNLAYFIDPFFTGKIFDCRNRFGRRFFISPTKILILKNNKIINIRLTFNFQSFLQVVKSFTDGNMLDSLR